MTNATIIRQTGFGLRVIEGADAVSKTSLWDTRRGKRRMPSEPLYTFMDGRWDEYCVDSGVWQVAKYVNRHPHGVGD